MSFKNGRAVLSFVILSMIISACGAGMSSIPAGQALMGNAQQLLDSGGVMPADSTSILKKLTKDVTIGSTVDLKNGDKGPRAISVVMGNDGKLKKNQILVCNFEDSKGNAGQGTTIEQFSPTPNSKPTTFVQSSKIAGSTGRRSPPGIKSMPRA